MIVLGLHFGHDAGVSVMVDGRIAGHYARERHARVKHAIGLAWADVDAALRAFGVAPGEVDFAGVTSTQNVEYVFFDPDRLSFRLDAREDFAGTEWREPDAGLVERMAVGGALRGVAARGDRGHLYHGRAADLLAAHPDLASLPFLPPLENFGEAPGWTEPRSMDALRARRVSAEGVRRPAVRMHQPIRLRLDGREIPGALFSHHLAHAAYGYYESPFQRALVITQDGGAEEALSYVGGMFYLGEGAHLWPVAPHHLDLGAAYAAAGAYVGFPREGCEGKLMGLASYGRPAFYREDMLRYARDEDVRAFATRCAGPMGYDTSRLGRTDDLPHPLAADVAASVQRVVEESLVRAADAGRGLLRDAGIEVEGVVLGGGVALNCPANSRLHAEGGFGGMHISPACGDDGLAMGSCYLVHHHLLGHPFRGSTEGAAAQVYRGRPYGAAEVRAAVESYAGRVRVVEGEGGAVAEAARRLAEGELVCWFDGRSEVGPRALGHRSVLADPRAAGNATRVNRLKRRETWRPLAPAVLAEESAAWFRGMPESSPFMLFTGRAADGRVPAVTHADGTARVQTVAPDAGAFHALIRAFAGRTGVPVLLNTSFNGPGEPIVETPEDALRFFAASAADALYLQGTLLERTG
ncbi:MAG TPA: carbamoyltransferase C-terminal domain-containing protein [Longimicrobium sp.]